SPERGRPRHRGEPHLPGFALRLAAAGRRVSAGAIGYGRYAGGRPGAAVATPAQVHLSDAQLPESPGHNPDARAPGAINRTGAETRNGRGGRQSLWRTAL